MRDKAAARKDDLLIGLRGQTASHESWQRVSTITIGKSRANESTFLTGKACQVQMPSHFRARRMGAFTAAWRLS
jgi:hypothetical protein